MKRCDVTNLTLKELLNAKNKVVKRHAEGIQKRIKEIRISTLINKITKK